MRAANIFVSGLKAGGRLAETTLVRAELFGSLGATGHGHGSDKAVLLGLSGEDPETVDTATAEAQVAQIKAGGKVALLGVHDCEFELTLHRRRTLPFHPNGMIFTALGGEGAVRQRTYYSVGGGFVVDEATGQLKADDTPVAYPFRTGAELLAHGERISDLMMANELAWRSEAEIKAGLLRIWQVMQECVQAGLDTEGTLPGGLKVARRAHAIRKQLESEHFATDPLRVMDWVTLFALAVMRKTRPAGAS